MNLMQKLSLQKEYVEDWRQLVESIMIDWNYDGVVMQPSVTDIFKRLSEINWIVVGTMTGAQSRKIHTEPEWAWSLTDQAHKLGIPVFMKEDLVPIIGDENMIQEMPEEFNKVLEVQKSWKK